MKITLDAWGFTFVSELFTLYIQRSAIIGLIAIYATLKVRQMYLTRKAQTVTATKPARTRKLDN
jgi:hypothetical protein